MNYVTRVTQLTVMPEGDPLFSECATIVEIQNDGSGDCVIVRQQSAHVKAQEIAINSTGEWNEIKAAVEQLLNGCVREDWE